MIQPALRQQALGAFQAVIRDANHALIKQWLDAAQSAESVNVTRDISMMTLEITLRLIFGPDYPQLAPHFRLLSDESARDLRFAYAFRALNPRVTEVVIRRQNEQSETTDLLGTLMAATTRDGQMMETRQLVKEVMTLIVAGHETTASTLNWTWYLLSQHPLVEARFHAALEGPDDAAHAYARRLLEETMRLYPAGWMMSRRALRDDQIGPWFVPAGTEIYLPVYTIQRHPAHWAEPDRFDPDRFELNGADASERHPLALLPFSAGPRNCIGEHVARMEMQMHMILVGRRLRFVFQEMKPPKLDLGVNLRCQHDFHMTPIRTDHD